MFRTISKEDIEIAIEHAAKVQEYKEKGKDYEEELKQEYIAAHPNKRVDKIDPRNYLPNFLLDVDEIDGDIREWEAKLKKKGIMSFGAIINMVGINLYGLAYKEDGTVNWKFVGIPSRNIEEHLDVTVDDFELTQQRIKDQQKREAAKKREKRKNEKRKRIFKPMANSTKRIDVSSDFVVDTECESESECKVDEYESVYDIAIAQQMNIEVRTASPSRDGDNYNGFDRDEVQYAVNHNVHRQIIVDEESEDDEEDDADGDMISHNPKYNDDYFD